MFFQKWYTTMLAGGSVGFFSKADFCRRWYSFYFSCLLSGRANAAGNENVQRIVTPRKGTELLCSWQLLFTAQLFSERVPGSLHSQPTCSSQGQPKQALVAWLSCWELLTARAASFPAGHRCSPHGLSRWEHHFAKTWWSLVAETQNPHLAWDLNLALCSILCSEPNQTAVHHENQTLLWWCKVCIQLQTPRRNLCPMWATLLPVPDMLGRNGSSLRKMQTPESLPLKFHGEGTKMLGRIGGAMEFLLHVA